MLQASPFSLKQLSKQKMNVNTILHAPCAVPIIAPHEKMPFQALHQREAPRPGLSSLPSRDCVKDTNSYLVQIILLLPAEYRFSLLSKKMGSAITEAIL